MHFFQPPPKFWRTLIFLLGLYFITSPTQASESPSSIAVFDWTIAEALLSLDPPPVLMGNVQDFHTWTGNDYVDADIINIGTRSFPNMELLSSIDPQYILLAPRQTRMAATLANIAPSHIIHSFPFVNNSGDELWENFDAFILEIGELSGRRASAEQLITNTKSNLASLKDELDPPPPLLVVQLMTEQYVRVYGENSMFQGVLDRLGLQNAWTRDTDIWGRSLVSVRELFNDNLEDARLVIIESPLPVGIEHNIEMSDMWRYLPSVQRGDYVVLPSTFWIGGVHPSALRFAEALVEALETSAEP
ncbi:ABC transporter substrate-binding protein [Halomonas sp. SpR8]|uniref:ABC transporter substrate-binding protein n=1 Tax=Halomonas sp. SpR8 TaxID=3050463 RepID=UPI0027E3E523|nr:ABC transporter substrate-binding protein [Halomonas sp. SpR8]MDQ7727775.1 ABC transporter substrate-binding protein [Halomonas sp. SpR8]